MKQDYPRQDYKVVAVAVKTVSAYIVTRWDTERTQIQAWRSWTQLKEPDDACLKKKVKGKTENLMRTY